MAIELIPQLALPESQAPYCTQVPVTGDLSGLSIFFPYVHGGQGGMIIYAHNQCECHELRVFLHGFWN